MRFAHKMMLSSKSLYLENNSGLEYLFISYVIHRVSAGSDCLRLSPPIALPCCLFNICIYCTQRHWSYWTTESYQSQTSVGQPLEDSLLQTEARGYTWITTTYSVCGSYYTKASQTSPLPSPA